MLLAVAALMFHVSAIPQSVAQLAPIAAASSGTIAPAETIEAAQATRTAPHGVNSAITLLDLNLRGGSAEAKPRPAPAVAYTPGRLVPEPVAPVNHPMDAPMAAPASADASPGPAPAPFQSVADQSAEQARAERRRRHLWMLLGVSQHGAAAFDAAMTRRVIASGAGQELNPLLRPFAGNASLYFAAQVTPVLLDYAGHRLMTTQHDWAQRIWWIPQTVSTAVLFAGGVHNIGVHQ